MAFSALAANIDVKSLGQPSAMAEVMANLGGLGSLPQASLPSLGKVWGQLNQSLDDLSPAMSKQGGKVVLLAEHLAKGPTLEKLGAHVLKPEFAKVPGGIRDAIDKIASNQEQSTQVQNDKVASGEVVIPNSVVLNFERGMSSFLSTFANADIETLAVIVMMEASRDNNDDLRSMMAEMKAVSETKKAMRGYQTWLSGVKAAWQKEALGEYQRRQASGESPPSETFQEFMSGLELTLPVQQFKPNANPDTGSKEAAGTSVLPDPASIDFSFDGYKSPGQIREENRAMQASLEASAAQGPKSVPPLPTARAIELAKKYGCSPEDVQRFYQFYMTHPDCQKAGASLESWLEAGPSADPRQGPGLKVVDSTGKFDAGNQKKIDDFVGRLAELGASSTKDAEAKAAELEKTLAEMQGWGNLSAAEIKEKVKSLVNQHASDPKWKAFFDACGAGTPPDANKVVAKITTLVQQLTKASVQEQHAIAEGKASSPYKAAYEQNIAEIRKLMEAAPPIMKKAMGLAFSKEISYSAGMFNDSGGHRTSAAVGTGSVPQPGNQDIIGGVGVAGSGDETNADNYDRFTTFNGGSGYVDPRAVQASRDQLGGWVNGLPGLSSWNDYGSGAGSELQQQLGATKGEIPSPFTSLADDWGRSRRAQKESGVDGFGVETGADGSNVAGTISGSYAMNGGGQASGVPFFLGATPGAPYETYTQMKTMNMAELDAQIDKSKNELDSINELNEEMSMRLQMKLELKSKIASTLSNIMSKLAKTSEGITQNLK